MDIAKQVLVLPFPSRCCSWNWAVPLYRVQPSSMSSTLTRPCRCQNSGGCPKAELVTKTVSQSWRHGLCDQLGLCDSPHTVAVTVTRPLFFVLCSRCRIFVTSSAFRSSNASCHFSSCLPCSGQLDSSPMAPKETKTPAIQVKEFQQCK